MLKICEVRDFLNSFVFFFLGVGGGGGGGGVFFVFRVSCFSLCKCLIIVKEV